MRGRDAAILQTSSDDTHSKLVLIIKQKSIMQDYYLPDAKFGIEDSESYRANLLASIYLLMQED